MWKILGVSDVSVLYIYILIDKYKYKNIILYIV